MKKLLPVILFIIVYSSPCFAQEELLDVKILPNPANISAYKGNQDNKSVKQRIEIIDFNINNRMAKDTGAIINYDKDGRDEKYILFEKGKRYSITTYKYPDGKSLTVEDMLNLSPRYLTHFKIAYDEQGRKLSVYHADITNKDTTSRGEDKYDYKDGLLVKKQIFLNGRSVMVHQYAYNSSLLQQAETQTANSPAHYRYVYQYDADHLPVSVTAYHFYPKGIDTLSSYNFTYKDKKPVAESYTGESYPKKLTNVTFAYDASGRISEKDETRDTLYRNITFKYNGPNIASVITKTNTWKSWAHDPLMRNVYTFSRMPINYETDYYYDERGYLTKITETMNGILQWSQIYINTYY